MGVWKLIRCERKWADGRVDYPYGKTPVGRISYDKQGRMSAPTDDSGAEVDGGAGNEYGFGEGKRG